MTDNKETLLILAKAVANLKKEMGTLSKDVKATNHLIVENMDFIKGMTDIPNMMMAVLTDVVQKYNEVLDLSISKLNEYQTLKNVFSEILETIQRLKKEDDGINI